MVWVIDWGFLGGSPLLILWTKQTHGSWDTIGSPLLILFSLRFISQFRYALTSTLYAHRPPATMRDYLFVGGRDLLFSRSRFHCSQLPPQCLSAFVFLFPFVPTVCTLIIVSIPRIRCHVGLFFSPSVQVSRVSCFYFVIASAQSSRI